MNIHFNREAWDKANLSNEEFIKLEKEVESWESIEMMFKNSLHK